MPRRSERPAPQRDDAVADRDHGGGSGGQHGEGFDVSAAHGLRLPDATPRGRIASREGRHARAFNGRISPDRASTRHLGRSVVGQGGPIFVERVRRHLGSAAGWRGVQPGNTGQHAARHAAERSPSAGLGAAHD